MLTSRRPTRAAVARSLREAAILWKPPPGNDDAPRRQGIGEADNHTELKHKSTPTAGKVQRGRL